MLSLSKVLEEMEDGQKIVDIAATLGFQNVRLYNSFSENTLCIIVESNNKNNPSKLQLEGTV